MLRKSNFRNLSHINMSVSSNVTKRSAIIYGNPVSLIMVEWIVRGALLLIYLVTVGISVLSVWRCIHNCIDLHTLLLQVTECMVTISIPISLYHTWDHLTNFRKPKLQSQVVRMTWIVPIFCCESYLSLHFVRQAMYFQAIRELYEAYVIHCFMRLILQYLDEGSGGQSIAKRLSSYPASMGIHKPPFCCLQRWQMGMEFVTKCKTGVFQYVVIRFINTILTTILYTIGYYEEGKYSITKPFIWITIINFCSQSWALYSLFLFFLCVHKELQYIKPFSKFLCIKLIIFFSWWQGLIIGILIRIGRINRNYEYNAQEIAVFFRCTLISFEMIIAAIAFLYAFPVSEFYLPTGIFNTRKAAGKGLVQVSTHGLSKILSVYPALGGSRPTLLNSTIGIGASTTDGSGGSDILSNRIPGERRDTVATIVSQSVFHQAGRWLDFWGTTATPSQYAPLGGIHSTDLQETDRPAPSSSRAMEATVSFDSLDGLLNMTQEEGIMETEEEEAVHHVYPLPTTTEGVGGSGSVFLPAPPSPSSPCKSQLSGALPIIREAAHTHYRYGKASPSLFCRETAATPTGFKSPLLSPGSHNQIRRTSGSNLTGPGRALEVEFERHGGINDTASSCSEYSHDETVSNDTIDNNNQHNHMDSPFNLSALEHQLSNSTEHTLIGSDSTAKPTWNRPRTGQQRSPHRIRSTGSKGHRHKDRRDNAASPWFEALWMSTLPADLHEDLGELEAQLSELYTAVMPTVQFKRMIKSSNANS